MEQYVSGEENRCYYFSMNATEEWLRYIESRAIMQEYGITGYTDDKEEETKEENKEEEK